MKAKMIALMMALFMLGLAARFAAENPNMGTWKLNEAKSNFAPGATKNSTVVYEVAGYSVKVTTDGTKGDGKPVQTEWTGKFDGKEYPVTGGGASDTGSYKKVDDHILTITNETAGKVTTSGKITVSATARVAP